jgi:hypothetical protein
MAIIDGALFTGRVAFLTSEGRLIKESSSRTDFVALVFKDKLLFLELTAASALIRLVTFASLTRQCAEEIDGKTI